MVACKTAIGCMDWNFLRQGGLRLGLYLRIDAESRCQSAQPQDHATDSTLCWPHSTGNPSLSMCPPSPAGCRPSRIASIMSGARPVSQPTCGLVRLPGWADRRPLDQHHSVVAAGRGAGPAGAGHRGVDPGRAAAGGLGGARAAGGASGGVAGTAVVLGWSGMCRKEPPVTVSGGVMPDGRTVSIAGSCCRAMRSGCGEGDDDEIRHSSTPCG